MPAPRGRGPVGFDKNVKINKKTVLQIPKFTTLRIYQIPFDSYNTL